MPARVQGDCGGNRSRLQARAPRPNEGDEFYWFHMPVPWANPNVGNVVTILRSPNQRLLSMITFLNRAVKCCGIEVCCGPAWGWQDFGTRATMMRNAAACCHPSNGSLHPANHAAFRSLLQYPGIRGCQTKMMLGFGCLAPMVLTQAQMDRAADYVRTRVQFVGLIEKWPQSRCLWHARFGGILWSTELQRRLISTASSLPASAQASGHDEAVLSVAGYKSDVADEYVYSVAKQRFQAEVEALDSSITDCMCSVTSFQSGGRVSKEPFGIAAKVVAPDVPPPSPPAPFGDGGASAGSKPHLLYILADDLGWAAVDWHRPTSGWREPATPRMRLELKHGIELDSMYAFKTCSPSRSAIQSGRNPIYVNAQNYQPTAWAWDAPRRDPVSGFAGIPRNMTGLAEVLRSAGYQTAFVGKWDCGMATVDHTPSGKGYDTSLFYFHHDNDHWTSRTRASDRVRLCPGASVPLVDLWETDSPAPTLSNSIACAPPPGGAYPVTDTGQPNSNCVYEDDIFLRRVHRTIRGHNAARPLFLFWAPQAVHGPLQVPRRFLSSFSHVDDRRRQRYTAMVSWLDAAVGETIDLLHHKKMYGRTLILFTSDNGGAAYYGGENAGNNWPLRGGKVSNWQGGIRVPAWVSGGAVPVKMHGTKLKGLAAVWDAYATFAALAGADTTDRRAAAAGLPPVDSIDLWPYLSGRVSHSPRKRVEIGSTACRGRDAEDPKCHFWGWYNGGTIVQGLIEDFGQAGVWKLLTGRNPMSGWQGPYFPNRSTPAGLWGDSMRNHTHDCGEDGCLFRLDVDPTEQTDRRGMASLTIASSMHALLQTLNRGTFSPYRGPNEDNVSAACAAAQSYGGVFGPFLSPMSVSASD